MDAHKALRDDFLQALIDARGEFARGQHAHVADRLVHLVVLHGLLPETERDHDCGWPVGSIECAFTDHDDGEASGG